MNLSTDTSKGLDFARMAAELASLKASLVDERNAERAPWRFSPTERRIFGMLLASDVVAKRTIFLLLHDGREPASPDLKALDVFMARIRAKTSAASLTIETIHGTGYRLHDRAAWAKAISLGATRL